MLLYMIIPVLGLTLTLDMDLFLVGSFQHQNLSTWRVFEKNSRFLKCAIKSMITI